jgi:hypothetical protein
MLESLETCLVREGLIILESGSVVCYVVPCCHV